MSVIENNKHENVHLLNLKLHNSTYPLLEVSMKLVTIDPIWPVYCF